MFKGLKKLIRLVVAVFLIYVLYMVVLFLFPVKYSDVVEEYAQKSGVEKNLIYGIIKAQSGFDENALSNKGAIGLMQLKADTAKWCADKMGEPFEEQDLKDPRTNIKIGVWYLSYLKDELKSQDLAIIAYNAGISHVKKWIDDGKIDEKVSVPDNIPFEETRKYIKKVRLYEKVYMFIGKTQKIRSVVDEYTGVK